MPTTDLVVVPPVVRPLPSCLPTSCAIMVALVFALATPGQLSGQSAGPTAIAFRVAALAVARFREVSELVRESAPTFANACIGQSVTHALDSVDPLDVLLLEQPRHRPRERLRVESRQALQGRQVRHAGQALTAQPEHQLQQIVRGGQVVSHGRALQRAVCARRAVPDSPPPVQVVTAADPRPRIRQRI